MASTFSSGGICLANLSLKTLWVISPKKKMYPATFWKMSRPKARKKLGDIYPPKHRVCIENTCCEVFLKKIQYTLKDRFPRHFLDEYFGKHLPKLVIKQLPNRSMKYCWEVSSKTIRRLRDCYCIRFLGLKVSDRNFSAKKNFPGLVQKLSGSSGICRGVVWWPFLGRCFPKKNSGKSRGNLSFNVCWFLFRHTSQKAFSRHMRCLWGYLPKWFLAFGRDIFQKVAGHNFSWEISPRGFSTRDLLSRTPWGKDWCHTTP